MFVAGCLFHWMKFKIWRRTESTPRSGWWRSYMAGTYGDCSTREIIIYKFHWMKIITTWISLLYERGQCNMDSASCIRTVLLEIKRDMRIVAMPLQCCEPLGHLSAWSERTGRLNWIDDSRQRSYLRDATVRIAPNLTHRGRNYRRDLQTDFHGIDLVEARRELVGNVHT